jgi:hypothetical protein
MGKYRQEMGEKRPYLTRVLYNRTDSALDIPFLEEANKGHTRGIEVRPSGYRGQTKT